LLGAVISPVRRPLAFETWSPREIVTFEGALAVHGKCFHTVQQFIKTKTTKEVIEFYYIWCILTTYIARNAARYRKMSSHYKAWKQNFVSASAHSMLYPILANNIYFNRCLTFRIQNTRVSASSQQTADVRASACALTFAGWGKNALPMSRLHSDTYPTETQNHPEQHTTSVVDESADT